MKKRTQITAERLRELLHYDPDTGVFTRRPREEVAKFDRRWNIRYAGKEAGHINKLGYQEVCVDSRVYLGHRLAWLYAHGEWPNDEIDHINGNPSDNRLNNLREATRRQNARNTGVRRHSKTGLKGVRRYQHYDLWAARIVIDGRARSLGYFKSPEEAHKAYCEAAKRHYGEFFRAA